jgi:hypothetical protein
LDDEKFLRMIEAMYGGSDSLPKKIEDYDYCANQGKHSLIVYTEFYFSFFQREVTIATDFPKSINVAMTRTPPWFRI